MSEYETVIGLEVHVQLATRSKIFASATCAFGQEPNSQVDPTCGGLPGSLPVINDGAVELAIRAALAIDARIAPVSTFDRKHYFYPDMPHNFQITQYERPYCLDGRVVIDLPDGGEKTIGVTRIHMEADAGKLVHQEGGPFSEVDLNRAGAPLCEIVSEPDMRSPQEAYAYLMELRKAMKYCGVSDCEMQEGSLRCDANVSIRPVGQEAFGTKVEIKNLNSFRAVEAAIAYEQQQQIALHRAGRYAEVVQETKLWDPDRKVTKSMRGKEGASDYRYFPEPDLPPLLITEQRIADIRAALPELPRDRSHRFMQDLGLNRETALELTADKATADYFEALLAAGTSAKLAANWTREEGLRLAAAQQLPIAEAAPAATMAALISLVDAGQVARVVAKDLSDELFASGEQAEAFFTQRGKILKQDAGALSEWVAQAMAQEPSAVEDLRAGNKKAVGRLIGAVMKISGGQANPKQVTPEVFKQLG
ncbi:MAG: Asp-tRNA(Asn)/Glu-tRNA(Gln) amidotransferase subunit GatB [Planctomycetota bacterium]